MYLVGFNGPPKSGKDSIANMVDAWCGDFYHRIDAYQYSLAGPMREMGMTLLNAWSAYDDELYAELKAEPQLLLRLEPGMEKHTHDNLRQFMIGLAEAFIRPRYGRNFWARRLKYVLGDEWLSHCLVLVPDIGFKEEVDYFVNELGENNVLIVHTYREGCDWTVDSRRYVNGFNVLSVYNNGTLEEARDEVLAAMQGMNWNLTREV